MVVLSAADSDKRRDTQPTGASSSSSSDGARHKFRLLSSLPRAFFSFDRRALTKRRSSCADTSSTAAAAAAAAASDGGAGGGSDDNVHAATAHGPRRLLASRRLADTAIKQVK